MAALESLLTWRDRKLPEPSTSHCEPREKTNWSISFWPPLLPPTRRSARDAARVRGRPGLEPTFKVCSGLDPKLQYFVHIAGPIPKCHDTGNGKPHPHIARPYSSMPVENPLWTNVQGWVPPYHTGEEWLQTAPQAFTQKKDPHRRKAMGGLENQRSGTVGSTRPCRRKKQYYRSVYATRTRRVACSLSPMAKYTYSFAGIRREMRRERLVGIINIGQRERGTSPGNSPRLLSRFPGPETAGKLLPSLRYC